MSSLSNKKYIKDLSLDEIKAATPKQIKNNTNDEQFFYEHSKHVSYINE